MLKPKRGGKRENSGRKLMYGEPTQSVNIAVPKSKIKEYVQNAREFLNQYKKVEK